MHRERAAPEGMLRAAILNTFGRHVEFVRSGYIARGPNLGSSSLSPSPFYTLPNPHPPTPEPPSPVPGPLSPNPLTSDPSFMSFGGLPAPYQARTSPGSGMHDPIERGMEKGNNIDVTRAEKENEQRKPVLMNPGEPLDARE